MVKLDLIYPSPLFNIHPSEDLYLNPMETLTTLGKTGLDTSGVFYGAFTCEKFERPLENPAIWSLMILLELY